MNAATGYQYVEKCGVIAGMRGQFPPDTALEVTEILLKHGINVFELTMTSPQPLEAMQAVKRAYGDDACVGMGTVLNADDARRVLDAGADFVVSPAFQPAVVEVVTSADVLIAPGVITPSEAVAAWEMGVYLLKLFPIGAIGVDYLKAIMGPLGHMRFVCNGAMNASNAAEFIKAGAVAAGMVGWLTGDGTWSRDLIDRQARTLRQSVDTARGLPVTREI